jgi:hypothetical protein
MVQAGMIPGLFCVSGLSQKLLIVDNLRAFLIGRGARRSE